MAALTNGQALALGLAIVGASAVGVFLLGREEGENPTNPGSEVQTLLFKRSDFTATQAKAWAKSHGFKSSKTDVKPETIRIRQAHPGKFSRMRTIRMAPGVSAVVGWVR